MKVGELVDILLKCPQDATLESIACNSNDRACWWVTGVEEDNDGETVTIMACDYME